MARRYHKQGSGISVVDETTLYLPATWHKPRVVAVQFMGDLWHPSITGAARGRVLDVMAAHPRHTYLCLTKRPVTIWTIPSNVWLGVTVENQMYIDRLIESTIHRTWASFEPLLGPIVYLPHMPQLQWAVIGCESGPGKRPCPVEWVGDLVRDLQKRRVPVCVKQLNIGGKVSHDPREWPEHLRLRQLPWEAAP
jgi:protein gp37